MTEDGKTEARELEMMKGFLRKSTVLTREREIASLSSREARSVTFFFFLTDYLKAPCIDSLFKEHNRCKGGVLRVVSCRQLSFEKRLVLQPPLLRFATLHASSAKRFSFNWVSPLVSVFGAEVRPYSFLSLNCGVSFSFFFFRRRTWSKSEN